MGLNALNFEERKGDSEKNQNFFQKTNFKELNYYVELESILYTQMHP